MTKTGKSPARKLKYPVPAYHFVLAALKHTQESLGYIRKKGDSEEQSHVTGQELCRGFRDFAQQQLGLMAMTVFRQWGLQSTDDIGEIVFELIERGEMRKTEQDQLSDFFDVYDFREAFEKNYQIDVSHAFDATRSEA
ncbi:MAG: Minf_1886 family protein [Planctomycetales bacterium]